MEKKQQNGTRKIEWIVLCVFVVYTVGMFVVAQISGWNIFIKEIIVLCAAAGVLTDLKQYRTYEFRAKSIAALAWLNLLLYALQTRSLSTMLSTMAGLIVLLGLFCIPQIIYGGMILTTFIFLYHIFVAKTIAVGSVNDAVRVCLQLLSVYTVSVVTCIMIRDRQEASGQLIEKIHELEVAEKSKDDFMVNISHEIRTPINAVCGMSEAILQEELPPDVRKDVIDIQTAGRNLLATVSNILDFSELESGQMQLAEESYNITSTITDIINMALTKENGRHLELIVDCDANLPSNLVGDEQKLRRAVMNLLDNAMKFTNNGGIILRITGRKEEYGMNLMVSVKDSGIGITRTDVEKIFTSFSQVDTKRNRKEGGVGLGLAITQALVRSMGGFLTVNSTPGAGSEFLFTVPMKVLDETPIVSVKNKKQLFAACYINMDKYNYSVVREGYETCIAHMADQFGILFRICKNLPELKRRMEHEKYSHVFIGWEEYCEETEFFEQLSSRTTVVLILNYGQDTRVGSGMLRIYKPFTVLSIAAVFNGQKLIRNEEHISIHNRFIAPKANVLVVDDNAMNLKVMARLLLPYQIKVTMAGSGQEALDKLDHKQFDCVFLDHMMPEMDGVETLHRIRRKPGSYFQSLTVIAFTANAIGGAREMFLSEGFDDFIAKPIELSVLERMLRKYIPKSKQVVIEEESGGTDEQRNTAKENAESINEKEEPVVTKQEKAPCSPAEREEKALSALRKAGIVIEQAIQYCGDRDGFRDIIGIYHREGAKRKRQLEQYYKEADWKNYVIAVHALKSNSKGIGANELSELALKLEMAGKQNNLDVILEYHEALLEAHDELLSAIGRNAFVYPEPEKELTGRQPHKNGAEGAAVGEEDAGSGELARDTALLREKLDSFENDGTDEILDRLSAYRCFAETAVQIRNRLEDFDFPGAVELLEAWEHTGEAAAETAGEKNGGKTL